MAVARKETVVEGDEGFYHCMSRCVRRAFLCGQDPYTGKSFEHRRGWVQNRLEFLAGLFGMEICAFAVMSNHLHVILRTRPDWVEEWSDDEVAKRWLTLFPKHKSGNEAANSPTDAEIAALADERVGEYRVRLGSISWFMRCLNETIARRANREDDCTGRFWEGRYKCQSLLDESAVLACLAYVDLNPVRAGEADSPESSLYTSAYLRLTAQKARARLAGFSERVKNPTGPQQALFVREKTKAGLDSWLCPLEKGSNGLGRGALNFAFPEYLDLLDWTGRQLREGAKGAIPEDLGSLIVRFSIDRDNWLTLVESYGGLFYRAAGKFRSLQEAARKSGRRWFHGLKASRRVFIND
ncbi:MAG: hypothetical protein V1816_18510 [Pseudomonadota bacterium]